MEYPKNILKQTSTPEKMLKITFIGTGYVGLVSGIMMSHLGHQITCYDVDLNRISLLQQKVLPIFERDLEQYLQQYANTDRLQFIDQYGSAIADSSCIFITVGTPQGADGSADVSEVFKAVAQACKYVSPECIIVIKSTVPPSTCQAIQDFIINSGYKNEVVSNPEFLREGSAVLDFIQPDRIIVGVQSKHAVEILQQVYQPLLDKGVPLVTTDLTTAELIKYTANAFLANKVAFINEIADLCERIGADVTTLVEGIGLDQRIGNAFLSPGPGFGGSCFPKDILALQCIARGANVDFLILDAVIQANNNRAQNIVNKITSIIGSSLIGSSLSGKKIAVLGLTYKAGTDDIRCSPAIKIIDLLKARGADIVAYDPQGMAAQKYLPTIECVPQALLALDNADALVITTEWSEFSIIDYKEVKRLMKAPIIFDLRNILDKSKMAQYGFTYYSVGASS